MTRLSLLLAILALHSCSEQRIATEQELKDYIIDPENGLKKQTVKNGIDIEVIYRPTDLILAQQLNGWTDPDIRLEEIKNFKRLSYFIVSLSRRGQEIENAYAGDPQKSLKVINYLSSQISQNIYLVNNEDTIPALDAVYTRMFGAATATSIMTVFNSDIKSRNGRIKFILEDTDLDIGHAEFEFDVESIKKTPTLNLN